MINRHIDNINYLMLMIVDRLVHFHVLPRYREVRTLAGIDFEDAGWPAAPDLKAVSEITEAQRAKLVGHLRACWPCGPAQPSA